MTPLSLLSLPKFGYVLVFGIRLRKLVHVCTSNDYYSCLYWYAWPKNGLTINLTSKKDKQIETK